MSADTDNKSATTFTNYIQNVADTNAAENGVPEMWLPELWHTDSKTGRIIKQRLPHDELALEEESMVITAEPESANVLPSSGPLLPVEEEEYESETESQATVS